MPRPHGEVNGKESVGSGATFVKRDGLKQGIDLVFSSTRHHSSAVYVSLVRLWQKALMQIVTA
jgi:hypothetical protein